jgi:hypothetical protein
MTFIICFIITIKQLHVTEVTPSDFSALFKHHQHIHGWEPKETTRTVLRWVALMDHRSPHVLAYTKNGIGHVSRCQ